METKTKPLIMLSLKQKAAALPQIDLNAKDQPEIVINVKFGDITIKQILVNLDRVQFQPTEPSNKPKIEFSFTDVV